MKNKILTALLSLAIAVGVWLYVVTVVSPNSDKHYYNIPVVMQGEAILQERGLMITTTEQPTVSLHLEGNRTDLDKLNSGNITINVDVSRIYEAGSHDLTFTPTYPGNVPNNAITVLKKNPGTITLTVEERVSKPVPVEVRYSGTLSDGFMADKDNKVLDVDEINIAGPKSKVDQIKMARINVDLEGKSESISGQFQYVLCDENEEPVDAELVTTDTEKVNLTLRILRAKEIALEVTTIGSGSVSVEPKTIQVSGSDSLLEKLESINLGTVDFREYTEETTLTIPIKLDEGITNETGVAEATVVVKFTDLETKTLTVSNINFENTPTGLSASLITKKLDIILRGSKDKLSSITADNLRVVVDLEGESAGDAKINAQITVNVDGVDAIGSYPVMVKLKKR